ncbi:hypothetical protein GCM10012275_54510 [Longimycelium tulufanense]|uniref:Uncharacterized protein n=1 Tax=Longimycelium tulufanense TaxID=907463 RepID=A0A8J3CJP4_9PSEU|nr:hypothetical protein [Longimycelium tulufanense]GGM76948.1 hypothetical protein GCM10012275_54510 [Longimycelium tulufanense]
MTAGIPAFVLAQAGQNVTIRPYQGSGPYGPVYGAAVTVRAIVVYARRLVRDDQAAEVLSESTLYCQPGTTAPPESEVTLPDGRKTVVLQRKEHHGGTLGPSCVEAVLA